VSAVQIESAYASDAKQNCQEKLPRKTAKQNNVPSEEEVMKTDKLVSRRSIIRTSGKTLLACSTLASSLVPPSRVFAATKPLATVMSTT
jgi:hypothetical protein